MKNGSLKEVLKGIAKIYVTILKRVGTFFAFLGGAVLGAGIIVLPIWYFSKNHPGGYSIAVAACIMVSIVFLIIRRSIRRRAADKILEKYRFTRFLWQFAAILIFFGWIYSIAVVMLRGMVGLAVILIITFITAFGFFLYAKYTTNIRETT